MPASNQRSIGQGARLVFLCAFLAVSAFQAVWWFARFHFSAPFWLLPILSLPWWGFGIRLVELVPEPWRQVTNTLPLSVGLSMNATIVYVAFRIWRRRHNKALQSDVSRSAGARRG